MASERPRNRQRVEVNVRGQWVPATFLEADSVSSDDPDCDEVWWMDHFLLEDGDTIPEDTHEDGGLPPWRAIT